MSWHALWVFLVAIASIARKAPVKGGGKVMIRRIALLVVLALLIGPGCAPKIGRDFNKSSISNIEPGVTTKAEVRENLGQPQTITTKSTEEVWSYQYMEGANYPEAWAAFFGARERGGIGKMLVVTFDGDRVRDFSYREAN
jgi:outer membrane protein assembly factor BamE (lipoprotein component of BamABCDE complex)